jgi:hypothetical protein
VRHPTLYRVTRFVAKDEPDNWLGTDAQPGEVFAAASGCTYGAIKNGIALEKPSGWFFEFPLDAVERVEADVSQDH